MTGYEYGMRLRPCGAGCQPREGFCDFRDDDGSHGRRYWDVAIYNRKLTDDEMSHYSMDYLGEAELYDTF